MRRVVCPGSFDPVTNGHIDIISRAAQLYDEVVVAVVRNSNKTSLFTVDERVELLREATSKHDNVRVDRFEGLIVDFCRDNDISAIVKGLRAVSDFDYEMQMAQMNYNQAGVETLFMTTNPLYAFLSSSLVKEFAKFGGDVSGLVPGRRCSTGWPSGGLSRGLTTAAGCRRFARPKLGIAPGQPVSCADTLPLLLVCHAAKFDPTAMPHSRKAPKGLDSRNPLVFDTRDLGPGICAYADAYGCRRLRIWASSWLGCRREPILSWKSSWRASPRACW